MLNNKGQLQFLANPIFLIGLAIIGIIIFANPLGLDITSEGGISTKPIDGYILLGDSEAGFSNERIIPFQGDDGIHESKFWRWVSVGNPSSTQFNFGNVLGNDFIFKMGNVGQDFIPANPVHEKGIDGFVLYKEDLKDYNFRTNIIINSGGGSEKNRNAVATFNAYLCDGNIDEEVSVDNYIKKPITIIEMQRFSPKLIESGILFNCVKIITVSGVNKKESGLLEIKPKIVDEDNVEIFWQGVKSGEIKLSNYNHVYFYAPVNSIVAGGSQAIELYYPRYLPKFGCQLEDNDLFVTEEFTEGETVSLFSTRYPIKKLCFDQPAQIIREGESGVASTVEPYLIMISGDSLTVKEGEVIRVNYIMDNSDGLIATNCGTDQSYDLESKGCIGFAQVCSSGVFDSTTGSCVSTTAPEPVCEAELNGVVITGRYDVIQKRCIYNPSEGQVCDIGTFNPETGTCEKKSTTPCPTGFVLSTDVNGNQFCAEILSTDEVIGGAEAKEVLEKGKPLNFFERIVVFFKGLFGIK